MGLSHQNTVNSMRMIGIGLLGFLLAGIALLLSTMNILEKGQRYVREITNGPQLVFEHRTPAEAESSHTATLSRTNSDHPVILSGFPAYQSVAFTMPVDARPTSGYLQINATSQVLDGVEGVLRISIHNTRRGEMLLRPGEVGRTLQIPLSPTDLAGSQLVVSFSLQGTGPQSQCGPDDGLAAVVEIETTSAVYLTLDAPLETARDRVRAWGDVVRVGWPHWLKEDEQLRRLVLAAQSQRRGLTTAFQNTEPHLALTTKDLREVLQSVPDPVQHGSFDGRLAQSGASAGVRRFHHKAVWRERYDLAGAYALPMPKELALNMQLGHLLGDAFWSLSVTLNDRLVYQSNIAGAQGALTAYIDLPTEVQAAANTLEIVATTTRGRAGPCDEGPELVAEVLPTSHLIAGDAVFADPMSEMHRALKDVIPIRVAMVGQLNAADAARASHLLNLTIPHGSPFKPSMNAAHVTVLAPDSATEAFAVKGPAWLVTPDPASEGAVVRRLKPGDPLPASGLALLVTPQAGSREGAKG